MLQPYIPLLLLLGFVIANAIMMLGVSHIFSTYRRTPTKIAPYESGMPVLGDARERFSVKFYLVALQWDGPTPPRRTRLTRLRRSLRSHRTGSPLGWTF